MQSDELPKQPRRSFRGVVVLVLLFSSLPVAGRLLLRDQIGALPEYRLAADQVAVTPPPEWVNDDFVSETLRASGLDADGSLLDENLPQKLARAFSVAPWVAEVRGVEVRYPSAARIELSYREPVALVELPQGLYPVDKDGVLLPTAFFIAAPEKQRELLVIGGVTSTPLGTAGTLWGDAGVHAAARLASILCPVAADLELATIHAVRETPHTAFFSGRATTTAGTEIIWGRIDPTDKNNETKIGRLREMRQFHRSLDNVPANLQPIDLTKE